jgi:carbon monoxide dehydrogenase subunit G
VRIVETFYVCRPREAVFDYLADPSKLGEWQTSSRSVEPLTPAPAGPGSRFRERTKAPGMREFEQITEFAEFERPSRLRVRVVGGPQPIDGTWMLEPAGEGTRVTFVAEGELRGAMRLVGPVIKPLIARRFAGYHRNLRRNLEAGR